MDNCARYRLLCALNIIFLIVAIIVGPILCYLTLGTTALVIGSFLATVIYLTTAILGISVAVKLQTEDSDCNIPLYLYINNRVVCGIITLGLAIWLIIKASTDDNKHAFIIVLVVVMVGLSLEITSLFIVMPKEYNSYHTSMPTKIYSTTKRSKKPATYCCEQPQTC
ncbi:hypothetical protein GJ496_005517 [Pomphorhynchus laevis]|nr:hypothetical protein GJ496_005517 [Pomphorhynchus laevis]